MTGKVCISRPVRGTWTCSLTYCAAYWRQCVCDGLIRLSYVRPINAHRGATTGERLVPERLVPKRGNNSVWYSTTHGRCMLLGYTSGEAKPRSALHWRAWLAQPQAPGKLCSLTAEQNRLLLGSLQPAPSGAGARDGPRLGSRALAARARRGSATATAAAAASPARRPLSRRGKRSRRRVGRVRLRCRLPAG